MSFEYPELLLTTQPPQGQVAGARSPQAGDLHRQPTAEDPNALGPRLQLDLL